jgi:hypothetical protein
MAVRHHRSPKVLYKKEVSDVPLKLLLVVVAEILQTDIKVHSGDRSFVPMGGSKTSHHLAGRAADFHAVGMSDEDAFEALRAARDKLETRAPINRFQVLRHGPFTTTEGPHLHIGEYPLIKALVKGVGLTFWVEGINSATGGKYSEVK